MAVRLETLNTAPFLSLLLRKKPDLRGEEIVFTVTLSEGGENS